MALVGKLSWGTRAAWLLSAMPELIKSFAWDAFVLFYYAQVVGLDGALLGGALLIILICDAMSDPLAGVISDRLRRAPMGRRRTLMAAGILPFTIGLIGVFSVPSGLSQLAIFGWLLGFGLLARVGISFYSVPTFALGAELSREPQERALVATLRNVGNQLAILILPTIAFSLFFAPSPQFERGQLNPAPYPWFGVTAAAISVFCMLVAIVGLRKRAREIEAMEIDDDRPQQSIVGAFRELIDGVSKTPKVGLIFLMSFAVLVVTSTVSQLSLHLATYFWKIDEAATQRLLYAGSVGALIAFALAPMLIKVIGSQRLMMVGLFGYFVSLALVIMLPYWGLAPLAGTAAIGWFVFALRTFAGVAYGVYVVPFNTVIYDVSDHHEANTGRPQQGFVASLMFIGLRAGSALTGLVAGLFLNLIHFPVGLPIDQVPDDKVRALALFVTAIIVIAGVGLLFIVRGLQVSREEQREVLSKLEARRAREQKA
ncbi:MAG: MFS transporter [Hyphomonadaceae bacterium]|nr:MFS transporter [Hyphomonadaceae bacterium]